jgi:hypothetical protein
MIYLYTGNEGSHLLFISKLVFVIKFLKFTGPYVNTDPNSGNHFRTHISRRQTPGLTRGSPSAFFI